MNNNNQQNSTNINWFPGHMAKTRREIEEKIKMVDLLIELLDARIPFSSRNPLLEKIDKKRLIVLTKPDLADDVVTSSWKKYFNEQNIEVLVLDLKTKIDLNKIALYCQDIMKDKIEKDKKRGINPRPIRAMIVGIPNVGKSTLINRLSERKATRVANKPGHTKSLQWVKNDKIELLDTPGILWPKFEDQETAIKLALIGSIKMDILNKEQLVVRLLIFLSSKYPEMLKNRYGLEMKINNEDDAMTALNYIGNKRGFLVLKGNIDIEKTINTVLKEFRDSVIGKCSLESPYEKWF